MSSVFSLTHGGRKRLIDRWNALLSRCQVDPDTYFTILDDLLTRYSEPQRVYHGLSHIEKLLDLLPNSDNALEFAIWFHDAIYDPTRTDNEEQSARLASERLAQMGLNSALAQPVETLILATKTHRPSNPTEQWLVEADLSILGASAKIYKSYSKAIRQEYSWIPEEIFVPRRIQILEGFLARPKLYGLPAFSVLEAQARHNMQGEIKLLSQA